MKILFYNDFLNQLGGVEVYQSAIGEGLSSMGFDVDYVYGEEGKSLKNDLFYKIGMVAGSLLPHSTLENRLRSKIKEFQPNIIHINNNKLYTSSVLKVVRESGVKVVSAFHDFHFSLEPGVEYNKNNLKHFWKRILLKRIDKSSNVMLAYAHIVRQCLLDAGVKEVSKLPLFVDESRWTYKEDCYKNEPIILFFGRVVEQKGVFLLLEAFKKVKAQVPDAQLHYVGMGASYEKLKSLAKEFGRHDAVVVHGKKDLKELLELLHRSSVSVVPSIWPEPFGLTGLESQSAGVPVIGAAIGGIPEWCVDSVSGLLFEPNNAAMLSEKILQVLQETDFAHKLSKSAKQFCHENYSFTEVLKSTAAFYQNLIR